MNSLRRSAETPLRGQGSWKASDCASLNAERNPRDHFATDAVLQTVEDFLAAEGDEFTAPYPAVQGKGRLSENLSARKMIPWRWIADKLTA